MINPNHYIQSPLNYTGGKFKLLPQILPLFPKNMHLFVDLFCGGATVGINVSAERIILNDSNIYVTSLFHLFQTHTAERVGKAVERIIENYGLSNSSKFGYEYYNCESYKGLCKFNRLSYNKLREDFNSRDRKDDAYYYMLYVLIVYAFNNQIRFNSAGKFNLPVGKRDFNDKMKKKLQTFINAIHRSQIEIRTGNFNKLKLSDLCETDFIYADPPYLFTCATYNEKNGWNERKENILLSYLDDASQKGIKFALSNVLSDGEHKNTILCKWLKNHREFTVHELDYDYSNSNYHKRNKEKATEILITNY